MLKLLIFDMDGLLIDSERILMKTIKNACREQKIKLNERYYREQIGSGMSPDMRQMFPESVENEISSALPIIEKRMREALRQMWKSGTPKKPGADELISWLKENGILIAVASSSDRMRVEEALKSSGLYEKFDYILSRDEYKKGKPYPDVFLTVCNKFNVQPEEAIVLEDSNAGGLAAYRGQIPYMIVPDLGIVSEDVLKHALKVVKSLEEVPEVLSIVIDSKRNG